MLEALATLLVFQTVGEVLSYLLQLPVPGPVIGMALLLGLLAIRPTSLDRLRPTSLELLKHLSLLFVPAGVGVMLHVAPIDQDPFYTGQYDLYTGCQHGGHNQIVITTMSADHEWLILLRVNVLSEADLRAATRIFETFQALGNPEEDSHHDH